MRTFVTGATGFIGSHLCKHWAARGDHVIALARNPEKAKNLPSNVEVFRGDLASLGDERTTLPPCDVVVHLAGVVAASKLDDYAAINHRAVEDLLACLARQRWKPQRLLFASSLAAAGPSLDKAWTEADALQPVDPYGAAKALAEQAVQRAPFPTTIFRPPMVFGPGDGATLTLFKSARSSIGFRVAGAPQRLSFVDARDLVDAITLMADDRRAGNYVYYVSHPDSFDVTELWRALGTAVGSKVRVVPLPRSLLYAVMRIATLGARILPATNQLDEKQYQQMVAPAFVCSSELITRDLGWRARYDLGQALSHAAEGYRQASVLRA